MKVIVHDWIGGLGNNIEQIGNASWFAQSSNGVVEFAQKHNLLNVPRQITFGPETEKVLRGNFSLDRLFQKMGEVPEELFRDLPAVLQSLSIFEGFSKKRFPGLVIHVRGGNIFKKPEWGKGMIQAPLSYFDRVMEGMTLPKEILVLTTEGVPQPKDPQRYPNPMTEHIQRFCQKENIPCQIHKGSTKDAASYLLGAERAMITGYTTFSRMLLLSNPSLKEVYLPTMRYSPHDAISFRHHGCDVHEYKVLNYLTTWSRAGLAKQKKHPRKFIKKV